MKITGFTQSCSGTSNWSCCVRDLDWRLQRARHCAAIVPPPRISCMHCIAPSSPNQRSSMQMQPAATMSALSVGDCRHGQTRCGGTMEDDISTSSRHSEVSASPTVAVGRYLHRQSSRREAHVSCRLHNSTYALSDCTMFVRSACSATGTESSQRSG
jgi:hypothetical protein